MLSYSLPCLIIDSGKLTVKVSLCIPMNGSRAENGTHQGLPCVKGAVAKRLRDCAVQSFRLWKCIGEKVRGNDFAVESSGFGSTSAKWGQNGHGTFGRWAHREVCHYNPSVSFADSSPYTGEPLGVQHPPAFHSTKPPNSNLPYCRVMQCFYSEFTG